MARLSAFLPAGASPAVRDHFFLPGGSLAGWRPGIGSIMVVDGLGVGKAVLELFYNGIFFGKSSLILFFLGIFCYAETSGLLAQ